MKNLQLCSITTYDTTTSKRFLTPLSLQQYDGWTCGSHGNDIGDKYFDEHTGCYQAAVRSITSHCSSRDEMCLTFRKINELLETLRVESQVQRNASRISTALNQRLEEFELVLKNLEKMNRRIGRTKRHDRTERFIMAQGCAKKMKALHQGC